MLFKTDLFTWKTHGLHYVIFQSENDQDLIFKNVISYLKDIIVLLSDTPKGQDNSNTWFRFFL